MDINRLQIMIRAGDSVPVARAVHKDRGLLERRCQRGWTPLIVAAYAGKADIIATLIDAGADPNAANAKGTTPLMFAKGCFLRTGDSAAMEVLLAHGADSGARDLAGLTLLDYVPKERKAEVAAALASAVQGTRTPACRLSPCRRRLPRA